MTISSAVAYPVQQDPSARPTRLILVEDSARWPLVASTRPTETMVIAQSGDTYEAFGARAMRKLASLAATKRPVRSAFLAVGERSAGDAAHGRAAIARAVAAHMNQSGGGELIFVSQPESGVEVRRTLVSLADGLLAELGPNDISISIQFGPEAARPASKSGTRLRRVLP
jgi:hypothetical protein